MAALPRFDYFFDLPGELRKQILGYLLVKPGGVIIGEPGEWSQSIAHELGQPRKLRPRKPAEDSSSSSSSSTSFDDDDDDDLSSISSDDYDYDDDDDDDYDDTPGRRRKRKSRWPINYFLVSQTFHREATAVYFRENTFYLLATGRKPAPDLLSRPDGARRAAGSGSASAFGFNNHYHNHKHEYHYPRNNDRRGGGRRLKRGGIIGGVGGAFPGPCEGLLGEARYRDSRRRMRKVVVYVKALRGPLVEGVFKPLGDMYVVPAPSFFPFSSILPSPFVLSVVLLFFSFLVYHFSSYSSFLLTMLPPSFGDIQYTTVQSLPDKLFGLSRSKSFADKFKTRTFILPTGFSQED